MPWTGSGEVGCHSISLSRPQLSYVRLCGAFDGSDKLVRCPQRVEMRGPAHWIGPGLRISVANHCASGFQVCRRRRSRTRLDWPPIRRAPHHSTDARRCGLSRDTLLGVPAGSASASSAISLSSRGGCQSCASRRSGISFVGFEPTDTPEDRGPRISVDSVLVVVEKPGMFRTQFCSAELERIGGDGASLLVVRSLVDHERRRSHRQYLCVHNVRGLARRRMLWLTCPMGFGSGSIRLTDGTTVLDVCAIEALVPLEMEAPEQRRRVAERSPRSHDRTHPT